MAEINQMIDIGIVFKSETIIEAMDNYIKIASDGFVSE
jgi:hypothetical protein